MGVGAVVVRRLVPYFFLGRAILFVHLDEDMKKLYDPNLPIETLFDQIEHAKDLAQAAGAPYAEAQLLNTAYNLVFQSNVFHDTCHDWRKLLLPQKTWNNFKTMFTEAHQDFRITSTQGHSPYSANATVQNDPPHNTTLSEETTNALANLAAATATDRAALAALSSTNEHLTKQLTAVTKNLTTALAKIQSMETTVACIPLSSTTSHDLKFFRPYCHTHGFCVNKRHNSKTCKAPGEGHKRNATAINMMNGSDVGINDTIED